MGLELRPCTRSQTFFHGATLAGHFHFRLRSTISVHKFRLTTTSVDILPPQFSFIACACASMNELKNGVICNEFDTGGLEFETKLSMFILQLIK